MDIYICITYSLCCTPETNTTLEINSTPNRRFLKKHAFRELRLPVHSAREPFPGPLAGARGLVGASRSVQLVCILVSKLASRSGELRIICSGVALWLLFICYGSTGFKRQLTWAGDRLVCSINSLGTIILFYFI